MHLSRSMAAVMSHQNHPPTVTPKSLTTLYSNLERRVILQMPKALVSGPEGLAAKEIALGALSEMQRTRIQAEAMGEALYCTNMLWFSRVLLKRLDLKGRQRQLVETELLEASTESKALLQTIAADPLYSERCRDAAAAKLRELSLGDSELQYQIICDNNFPITYRINLARDFRKSMTKKQLQTFLKQHKSQALPEAL